MTISDILDVNEVAKELDIHRNYALALMSSQAIPSRRIGFNWATTKKHVEDYQQVIQKDEVSEPVQV